MNVQHWIEAHYLTAKDIRQPVTVVVDGVAWDEDAGEALLYLRGFRKPIGLTDRQYRDVCAVAGRSVGDFTGTWVRLYPVLGQDHLEIF
jgi:hypothetical protein